MNARSAIAARVLFAIFTLALAVRWAYAAGLFLGFDEEGLKGPDSTGYLVLARGMVDGIRSGTVTGWGWLGPDLSLMPFFPWLLALTVFVAGDLAALVFTLGQGVVDAGTAVLVALIAARFAGHRAALAGYAAALTPTFIVLSGLVYTDTLFVFLATFALYASLRWMETPLWRWAIAIGAGFGLASLVRIAGLPFAAAALLFVALVTLLGRRLTPAGLVQLAVGGLIVGLAVAPILVRNITVYASWSLTPQSGTHMAYWILPLVKEAATGTPREKTKLEIDAAIEARFGAIGAGNPFETSAKYRAYAEEELSKLGYGAIARAWLYGAAINLGAPAIVHVPPVSNLPRTGFYDTPGADLREKLTNFLFGSGAGVYAWLVIAGIFGVAVFRLVQLVGLIALLRRRPNLPGLILLGGWALYILLLNGPIASPKYRLPLEPVMAVLTGAGLGVLRRRPASTGLQA